jgi:hypothetical protein
MLPFSSLALFALPRLACNHRLPCLPLPLPLLTSARLGLSCFHYAGLCLATLVFACFTCLPLVAFGCITVRLITVRLFVCLLKSLLSLHMNLPLCYHYLRPFPSDPAGTPMDELGADERAADDVKTPFVMGL